MLLRFFFCMALFANPLWAAQLRSCHSADANAGNVDWSEPTRTYANGDIRFIKINIEEPACCAVFLMVLYPAGDDPFLSCTLVGRSEGYGWADLSLDDATASYDPKHGLAVTVPIEVFDGENIASDSVKVTINQTLGSVLVE